MLSHKSHAANSVGIEVRILRNFFASPLRLPVSPSLASKIN